MRFVLGHESAVGWHVLDGVRMKTFYIDAANEDQAQAYVEARNIIESYRTDQEQAAERGDAELMAILERRYRNAA